MKKLISVIGSDREDSENIKELLKSVFDDSIEVNVFDSENIFNETENLSVMLGSDLILAVAIKDVIMQIRRLAGDSVKLLPIEKTISESGAQALLKISSGSKVYIKDDSLEAEIKLIDNIYRAGISHVDMIPFHSYNENFQNNDVVEADIGKSVVDLSTIIDVGFLLDIDDKISHKNLLSCYRGDRPVPSSVGTVRLMDKFNKADGEQEIFMSAFMDYGIISADNNGKISLCNKQAEIICGIDSSTLKNSNVSDVFPQINYKKLIKNKKPLIDKLIKLNDYDVALSVQPILHSLNLYGAVIILKRFNEIEKKQHAIRAQLFGKGHRAKYYFDDIIGSGHKIAELKEVAMRMARSKSTILITGESGTGKELFAQAIHNYSDRCEHQFVALNCGSLPENLLESELFGYDEGAFTGAKKGGKIGLFELAHNGTMFLDEIGNMPLDLQNRLLRVLQERQVMRVGGDRLIDVDVRLIAATNSDLRELVRQNKFRRDLFYRINVLPLYIPPLRERIEDIVPIIENEKKKYGLEFEFTKEALRKIFEYDWEGNVRELVNMVEYVANLDKKIVEVKDLEPLMGRYRKKEVAEIPNVHRIFQGVERTSEELDSKYLYILNELYERYTKHERSGRRSIYNALLNKGIMIGEQEIRKILTELENDGLVAIYSGRGGTVITERGIRFLGKKD